MSEELSSSLRRGQRRPSSLRLRSDVLVSSTMLRDVRPGQWRAMDRTVPSPVPVVRQRRRQLYGRSVGRRRVGWGRDSEAEGGRDREMRNVVTLARFYCV